MKRVVVGSFAACSVLCVVGLAGAADHAVYARAHGGSSQGFTYPDLSWVAEAKHSVGAAGVDDAWVNNLARANARTGSLSISSAAGKATGPGMVTSSWGQVARIEQLIKPASSGGTSTARITISPGRSGNMQTTTQQVRLTGRVQIGSCIVGTSQIISSTGADPAQGVDNCVGSPTLTGSASPNAASITISNLPPSGLTFQAEVSLTYEGSAFVGAIQATIEGTVSVDQTNGGVVFGLPTFLAGEAPDGGAPDGSVVTPLPPGDASTEPPAAPPSGNGGGESGGTVPAVTPPGPQGGGGDDGGCQVSIARAPSRLMSIGSAAALLVLGGALARRSRRRGR